MAQKKEKNVKVQDLAPKKDAKGGAVRQPAGNQSAAALRPNTQSAAGIPNRAR